MSTAKRWLLCLAVCVLCSGSLGQEGEEDSENEYVEAIRAAFNEAGVDWNEALPQSLETHGYDFQCPLTTGRPIATNVHELTPYDIKVVGALGDSVTAGFGADAKTIFGALIEYRGVSWSIGGDGELSSLLTIPNIIKRYNPDVKGFSVKTGGPNSRNARNNVAVSGGIALDMPGQAIKLVDKIRADSSIDFENDWKLVNIWIGGNDLCRACNGGSAQEPANYAGYIAEAIEVLRFLMPRTFVNVVKIIDVTELTDVSGLLCDLVHFAVCRCAEAQSEKTREFFVEYNKELELMEKRFQDDSYDDFAVVLQPFMAGVDLPKDYEKYFAFDCFHFSTLGHEIAAAALWNNMLEPVGSKTDFLDLESGKDLNCPEEHGFFYTYKNSDKAQSFGIESNDPDPNAAATSGGSVNILSVLLGTGIALYVVGMVTVVTVVVVGVRWARRRRNQYYVKADSEKILLVKK